ncbi:uncharacterized protein M421DRAFT_153639 [Didymella exigua CBS 183.55]|uniref:Uncharacterized protein n=1 Tax=Didymella exigua CBS 183.55 TaxID=1150837 RepID=A0A6A5RNL4_9PLEO|nr:uncharacterized protein M421DRAFT_153639 [Didymella exigua CBS 183.55]KAF1928728.1 hypothetical protein M421DRAFT_153639 [Didymella exigua CBS 183.55]
MIPRFASGSTTPVEYLRVSSPSRAFRTTFSRLSSKASMTESVSNLLKPRKSTLSWGAFEGISISSVCSVRAACQLLRKDNMVCSPSGLATRLVSSNVFRLFARRTSKLSIKVRRGPADHSSLHAMPSTSIILHRHEYVSTRTRFNLLSQSLTVFIQRSHEAGASAQVAYHPNVI